MMLFKSLGMLIRMAPFWSEKSDHALQVLVQVVPPTPAEIVFWWDESESLSGDDSLSVEAA